MSNDSRFVLSRLVRSGIWSTRENILRYKRIILDVESIITYIYQSCIRKHLKRQQSLLAGKSLLATRQMDHYSGTLVNYAEYSGLINKLLDFFGSQSIEVHVVYRGKYMEAPIFGLLPAQFKKNSQRTCELLLNLINCEKNKHNNNNINLANLRPWRSNLALNIFKSIVSIRRNDNQLKIYAHQAFYCPYPTLAKLARDFKCPVLTNDGDFIIMDVRAGFVLFAEFWNQMIEHEEFNSKLGSIPSNASISSNNRASPKSSTSISGSSRSNRSPAKTTTTTTKMVTFNHSLKYLRQHPGLNAALVLQLFPLTSGEMIVHHSKSLVKLKIYDREYNEKDLVATNEAGQLNGKKYHEAAARIEQVLTFLCGKNPDLLAGLIRGEAFRLKSTFDSDYRELFNYYSVSYDFKNRLKWVLRQRLASEAFNYIESCLLARESSADYLLNLLCCPIGRLACVDYNKSLEFEDLQTKRSAHSMLDSSKVLLMSLFSENKCHKAEHSISLSNKQREKLSSSYSTASLTVIDREQSRLIERSLPTAHGDKKLASIGATITMAALCQGKVNKSDAIKLINLAFKSNDLFKLEARHEKTINKLLASSLIQSELSVMLSLLRYCLHEASSGDQYFKSTYSKDICSHFEVGLINAYLYLASKHSKAPAKELTPLINLINKQDLENVATNIQANKETIFQLKSSSSSSRGGKVQKPPRKQQSESSKVAKSNSASSSDHFKSIDIQNSRDFKKASKQIRHLIELLNSSLEAYFELNSFLNYPCTKLNLHNCYNPILLYNLTLYSYNNPTNDHHQTNNKTILIR